MQGSYRWVMMSAVTVLAAPATQQAPFNALEVSGGAHVVLRNGSPHHVRVVAGNLDMSRVEVTRSGALIIEKCRTKCPRGYRLELEVVAPRLTTISVAHGGRIQSRAGFPRQAALAVAVEQGGAIDVRAIAADRVTASIYQGGGILTTPRLSLSATVAHGGNITYWGDPEVKSSVDHAGAVQKAVN